jgi:general secretion pathway protein G
MKPTLVCMLRRCGLAAWEVLGLLALAAAVVVGGRFLLAAESGSDLHALTVRRIEAVSEALNKYAADNGGAFPTPKQGLAALLTEPTQGPRPVLWRGPYLKDPALLQDAWGRQLHYVSPGAGDPPRPFDLWSLGADNREGGKGPDSDICSWDRTTFAPPRS